MFRGCVFWKLSVCMQTDIIFKARKCLYRIHLNSCLSYYVHDRGNLQICHAEFIVYNYDTNTILVQMMGLRDLLDNQLLLIYGQWLEIPY